MTEENLYGLSDKVIEKIENEILALDDDLTTSEEFIDAAFPNLDSETKAKIAIFSGAYYELFLDMQDEE